MRPLEELLKECGHNHASLVLATDRIQVCFMCGSTKRPLEAVWTPPSLWSHPHE